MEIRGIMPILIFYSLLFVLVFATILLSFFFYHSLLLFDALHCSLLSFVCDAILLLCGFLKKLAYANGFPFGLPLTYLLASLWLPFWPTLGHVSGIHVAQVGRARGYSTGTGTLVTVLIRESEAVEVEPRCITYVQGYMRRVTARGRSLTGVENVPH